MSLTGAETKRFGERRQLIVNEASVLINEAGVQATTLGEVARAIGLNATSITYYFPRKEKLVVAVYEETLDLMRRMASEALEQPDPATRLHKYLSLHIELRKRIRLGERGLLTALSEIRTLDAEPRDALMQRYLEVVDIVRRFFGEARSYDERAVFSARAHMLLEAMMWWPIWSQRYSTRDFARVESRMFDIFANGIPAQEGLWQPHSLSHGNWRSDSETPATQIDEFLRAATVLINQRGYRGASVNRIAKSLNVTKGSFYHHHEAKDDLVLDCFQHSYDRISTVQLAGLELDSDYWTRFSSVMGELLDLQFFDRVPLLRTTALQSLEAEHKADVVTRSNRLARRFAGMLIDGIADGSVRAVDPLVAAQIIMSTLNGAYEARRWASRFEDRDKAIRIYMSTLTHGLLSPTDEQGLVGS